MAIAPIFTTSVTFTGLTCVSQADLDSAFSTISFKPAYGPVVRSNTAPNVATYPELAYAIWVQTTSTPVAGTWTGQTFVYDFNTTAWVPQNLYNGALINDHSIPLSKLVNGSAYQVIQMAADGSTAQWVNVSSLFSAGTVAISALVPSGSGVHFLQSNGTNTWATLATVVSQLTSFPITNLAGNTATPQGAVLAVDAAGTTISWSNSINGTLLASGTTPPTALTPGNEGQILQTTGGIAKWGATPINIQRVYATSPKTLQTGAAQDLDLSVVLPSGASTWTNVTFTAIAVLNSAATAAMQGTLTFKWNTSPLTATAVTSGASSGAGSSGTQWQVDHDSVSPTTWEWKGEVPNAISTAATLALRASLALSGSYDADYWQFWIVAECK